MAVDNLIRSGASSNVAARRYNQTRGARRLTSRQWPVAYTQNVVITISRQELTDNTPPEQP
eukprot:9079123-Lingulodinium_polyedra.AAC.1